MGARWTGRIARQDDRFDPLTVVGAWGGVPLLDVLQAASLGLLALAVLLLPGALGVRVGRLLLPAGGPARAVTVLVAVGVGVLAAHTWSGAGSSSGATLAAGCAWALGVPLLALSCVAAAPSQGREPGRPEVVLAVAVAVSTPLTGVLLAPLLLGYVSHDTTPWSDALGPVAILVAAATAWRSGRTPGSERAAALSSGGLV